MGYRQIDKVLTVSVEVDVTGVYQDRSGCWKEGLLWPGIPRGDRAQDCRLAGRRRRGRGRISTPKSASPRREGRRGVCGNH
jgi:hypothetical protein